MPTDGSPEANRSEPMPEISNVHTEHIGSSNPFDKVRSTHHTSEVRGMHHNKTGKESALARTNSLHGNLHLKTRLAFFGGAVSMLVQTTAKDSGAVPEDEAWHRRVAAVRIEVIRPLLVKQLPAAHDLISRAAELDLPTVDVSTWLQQFDRSIGAKSLRPDAVTPELASEVERLEALLFGPVA